MKLKSSITKSKRGHYKVTVRDARGKLLFERGYLSTLTEARRFLAAFKTAATKERT